MSRSSPKRPKKCLVERKTILIQPHTYVVYTGNGIRQVRVCTKSELRFQYASVEHLFIVATQSL